MGKEGFFGPAAHFHHRHPPTAWESFAGALNPHAYDLNKLPASGASPWEATPFMGNGDVQVRYWKTAQAMDHLVRNQDGDELLFVHDGAGEFFCDWGRLSYRDGDYIVIPRVLGEAVGLSPLLVLTAVAGVAFLFGEFAVLLAIPIAAVLATLVNVIVLDKDPAGEDVPTVIFPARDAETG